MVAKKWDGVERRSANEKLHIDISVKDVHDLILEIKEAFPNGDIDGHRRAHESMIKAAEAEERFWESVKLDVVKKGVWAVLIVIISLVVVGIYYKLSMALSGVNPIK